MQLCREAQPTISAQLRPNAPEPPSPATHARAVRAWSPTPRRRVDRSLLAARGQQIARPETSQRAAYAPSIDWQSTAQCRPLTSACVRFQGCHTLLNAIIGCTAIMTWAAVAPLGRGAPRPRCAAQPRNGHAGGHVCMGRQMEAGASESPGVPDLPTHAGFGGSLDRH